MIAELVLAVAVSTSPTTSAATSPTTLDGVKVQLSEGTEQVVTVNHTDGYRARVTFWKLTDSGWRARFAAEDGRIGYGGLVPRHQAAAGHRHHPAGHLRAAVGIRHGPGRRPVEAALPPGRER